MSNGFLDIIIIGSNYTRKQQNIYEAEAQAVRDELLLRPPFKQRATQLKFHIMGCRNNLRCSNSGGVGTETLSCSVQKISDAIGDVLHELIIILVSGAGNGGADGAQVGTVGTGSHDNSQVTNTLLGGNHFQRTGALSTHETGHNILGAAHVEGTIMGSMTNGGANGIKLAFNESQQDAINAYIDSIAGPWSEAIPPAIEITSPANGASVMRNAGGQILVRGTASASTMRVSLIVDGNTDSTHIFWERNALASPSSGIRIFPLVSPGSHTLQLKAVDAAYNETLSSVVTVNVT